MTVISYQSKLVLRILKAGETYRAKPNLTLRGEYNANPIKYCCRS